jgi:hypothetical protein
LEVGDQLQPAQLPIFVHSEQQMVLLLTRIERAHKVISFEWANDGWKAQIFHQSGCRHRGGIGSGTGRANRNAPNFSHQQSPGQLRDLYAVKTDCRCLSAGSPLTD